MKILKKICPICILVSLTWFVMLGFRSFGYEVDSDLLAMLMGGSAVGLSYTLANRLSSRTMVWKLVTIPLGFVAMSALFNSAWGYFLLTSLGYLVAWLFFRDLESGSAGRKVSGGIDINKELKKCC